MKLPRRTHLKKNCMIFTVLVLWTLCGPLQHQAWALESSFAGNYTIAESQYNFRTAQYEIQVASKFQRGVENFVLGWLEVPHGIKGEVLYRQQEYLPVGIETIMIGFFRGFVNAIGRTSVGFYEMFTSIYPQEPVVSDMRQWLY